MSSDSKKKGDSKSVDDAKAQAGDALSQTIVTGRKIVIDPETGQVRLEEAGDDGDETSEISLDEKIAASEAATPSEPEAGNEPKVASTEAPAQEAAPEAPEPDSESTAANQIPEALAEEPMGQTQAQPITQDQPIPEEPEGEAAVDLGDQTMMKANKRLSAETLFAFALPEPVINKALADAAKNAKTKDTGKRSVSGLGTKIGVGILTAALAGGAGAYFFLDEFPASDSMIASVEELVQESSEEGKSEPAEPEEEVASVPAAVEGPITAKSVVSLSDAQLATVLASGDVKKIAIAIVEASTREDQKLLEKVVALGTDDDYLMRVEVIRAFVAEGAYSEKTNPAVLAMLLDRLDDPEELVRGFAAKAIGASADKTALTKLRGRLDLEESGVVVKMIRAAIVELDK